MGIVIFFITVHEEIFFEILLRMHITTISVVLNEALGDISSQHKRRTRKQFIDLVLRVNQRNRNVFGRHILPVYKIIMTRLSRFGILDENKTLIPSGETRGHVGTLRSRCSPVLHIIFIIITGLLGRRRHNIIQWYIRIQSSIRL